MKYIIAGDKTGKTYGVYLVKEGEILPPKERPAISIGHQSLKEAQIAIKIYEAADKRRAKQ